MDAMSQPAQLELRVLEGPQAGARAPLAGQACLVAGAADADGADIVLRDDTSARVRITACGAQALLEVLEGEVQLGERTLAAGACAPWAMHAPLRIGGTRVAFGEADVDPWPAADPDAADTDDDPDAADAAPPEPRRMPRAAAWLLPLGLVVMLCSAAALGLTRAAAMRGEPPAAPPPALTDALKGSEFAALEVKLGPDGEPELRGRLATVAERTRLDAWLAAREFAPRVALQVDEGLARDVTDVFRVNGVAVQARVQGPGMVAVEAAEPDAAKLARAEEVVRRDVRGLAKMSVVNRAQPAPPPPVPLVDDPGKRVASVVPGDPAYLVTADGARYFVGAVLPSGHRITAIDGQRVSLERDGRASQLNF